MWFLDLLIALSNRNEAKGLLRTIKKWIKNGKGSSVSDKDKEIFKQLQQEFESPKSKNIIDFVSKKIMSEFSIGKNIGKDVKYQFGAKQKSKWKYENRAIYALFKKSKTSDLEDEFDSDYDGWDNAILSSSWLVAGSYSKSINALEITTYQGRSYVYPGVSPEVWKQMKLARGRNGSGAGSVFWYLYLKPKGWIRGKVRRYIKENIHPLFYEQNRGNKTLVAIKVSAAKRKFLRQQRYQKRMRGLK